MPCLAFTHRTFDTQQSLTQRNQRSPYTEKHLHREAFAHGSFYTQKLLHREAFTHTGLFAQRCQKFRCQSEGMSKQRDLTAKRSHTKDISQQRGLTAKTFHSNAISQQTHLTAKGSLARKLPFYIFHFQILRERTCTKASFSHLPLSLFEGCLAR